MMPIYGLKGASFNMQHLLMNFPYKKSKITCKQSEEITGDLHKSTLLSFVFRECLRMVVNDIIENNITFWLPTGARPSSLYMKRYTGEVFQKLRRAGKWSDVNILNSDFSGYQLTFCLHHKRVREVPVYVTKAEKDRITIHTNNGKAYGCSKYDKYLKDYYNDMQLLFPTIPLTELKRILNFCWKSLYLHISYGGDVNILSTTKTIWYYFGRITTNPMIMFHRYISKLALKIKILYKRKGIKWDGYYYFALGSNQYERYLAQKNKRGRPKKNFTFENIFLYRILDECKLRQYPCKYIFRIPLITSIRYTQFMRKMVTDKAELILVREPLKFRDLYTHYNNYDVL